MYAKPMNFIKANYFAFIDAGMKGPPPLRMSRRSNPVGRFPRISLEPAFMAIRERYKGI